MSVTQNLGKVCISPKGAWSAASTYTFLDLVSNNGSSYLALKSVPAGTALNNTEYWLVIAAKGSKGDTGNGISSVAKTSTVGNVDTYTISFTDGNTTTFTVTNGTTTVYFDNVTQSEVHFDSDPQEQIDLLQPKSDASLSTSSHTVVGAINEINDWSLAVVDGKLCIKY